MNRTVTLTLRADVVAAGHTIAVFESERGWSVSCSCRYRSPIGWQRDTAVSIATEHARGHLHELLRSQLDGPSRCPDCGSGGAECRCADGFGEAAS